MIKLANITNIILEDLRAWFGKVAEVLVDCKEYYLISTKIPIVKSSMWYTAQKQKTQVVQPTTYKELADIIDRVIQYYTWKNKK